MSNVMIARLLLMAFGLIIIGVDVWRLRWTGRPSMLASRTLMLIAIGSILGVAYLVLRQINFPLQLDLMEGTVLQHFERASTGKPIYPAPSPEFVALAYNPGYYVLSIPFGWVFGVNLFTLRLVSLLGMVGSGIIIGLAIWHHSKSRWWTLVSVGLFAAAYWTMDAYLNTAHSDSWFLFSTLIGTYIISKKSSYRWNIVAMFVLVGAFWFKQHGALFTIGGLLFLTWQETQQVGWRGGLVRSIPYGLVAVIFGPVFYLWLGPTVFGSDFHYFTYEVPSGWSELDADTIIRFGKFIIENYLILGMISGIAILWTLVRSQKNITIWQVQTVFAVFAGFMGSLDRWSSNNVYIPMGAMFIIMGTQSLYTFSSKTRLIKHYQGHVLLLFVAFAMFLFNPVPFLVSSEADKVYEEFIHMLQELNGQVYAPTQAYIKEDFEFYPSAHWVALEDMIRGPGRETQNHPLTRQLLEPVLAPDKVAYVLTNQPLEGWTMLSFLLDYYVLEEDFGDRFLAIRLPPKRFDHGYPRYLYRYDPDASSPAATP